MSKAKDLNDFAEELYKRAKDISNKNTENEVNLEKAKKNADNADKLAKKATEVCGLQIIKLIGLTVNILFQKYFLQLSCRPIGRYNKIWLYLFLSMWLIDGCYGLYPVSGADDVLCAIFNG